MEAFGMVLSVPAGFVASVFWCWLLAREVAPRPGIRRLFLAGSWAVLGLLALELALLGAMGSVSARARVGPAFYPLHLLSFFLGTPALANLLVLGALGPRQRHWLWAAPACALLAGALTLLQYTVSEALYGIDGHGGPYSGSGP